LVVTSPARLKRARWGSVTSPVRTNLPYPGLIGTVPAGVAPFVPQGQLLTNYPFAWELLQVGPRSWDDEIADDGRPPAWWIGEALEGPWPIGPHGPGIVASFASIPVVQFLTKLVADPLTRFRVWDPNDPARRLDTPLWLRDPQLLRPDDRVGPTLIPWPSRLPAATFWRDLVVAALWYGRSFLYFIEDDSGQPRAGTLAVLHPSRVVIGDDGRVRLGDDFDLDADGTWTWTTIDGRVGRGRVVQLRNPDNPWGVFAAYPDVFRIARKTSRYTEGTFGTGVPAGYLKVTAPGLTQDQADQLKAAWMRAHGGAAKSIAVLNATTDFTPIQLSPVDSGLADVRRLNYADVAFAFGVPPALIGTSIMAGGGSLTYQNLEQLWEEREDIVLPSWLGAVEGTLSALLPGTRQVAVDLDQYRYGTFEQRLTQYATGVAAGLDPVWLAAELNLQPDRRTST